MRKLAHFILYTSLYIVAVALLMVYGTLLLFHLHVPLYIYLFVAGGTMCSYNFHWFLSPPEETSLRRNSVMHLTLATVGISLAIVAAFMMMKLWFWLIVSMGFTFLYSAPKIPWQPFIWLRKIAIGKTIFLSAAWTYVTCFLPLIDAGQAWSGMAVAYLINRFLLIYAICIIFDQRDLESDTAAGIRTILTWLGAARVRGLFRIVIVLFLCTHFWLYNYVNLLELLALLSPGVIVSLLYRKAMQTRSDLLYYFVLDGLMMASTPLLLLSKFV